MTKWNCDPSPEPFNVIEWAEDEGRMLCTFRWTWDGVSVYPDCAGPLLGLRVTNTGILTWYAHLTGRRGQPRVVPIPPGTTVTRNAAWLAQRGLDTLADLDGFMITDAP